MNVVVISYGTNHTDHTQDCQVYDSRLFPEGVDEAYVKDMHKKWKERFATKHCAWYAMSIIRDGVLETIENYHPVKHPVVLNPAARKDKPPGKITKAKTMDFA